MGGPLSRERIDAVLFDMDGVLTDTAGIHAGCWKQLFDAFLRDRSRRTGEPYEPFDELADYLPYVDGKPREDGVRDFLRARGIELPEGSAAAPPREDSVRGLAARKDALVHEVLEANGVEPLPGVVKLLGQLREAGIKTGVVSSSRNCELVLQAAGLESLLDTRMDGTIAAARGLPGKPAPDTFLAAAAALAASPERSAVIEDAIAGVQAARRGGFQLVVGVARHATPEALEASGADRVVRELDELLPVGGP